MTPWRALLIALMVLGTVSFATVPPAYAKDDVRVKACLADHVEGQELRAAGKLLESREAFVQCAQDGCPTRAVADCSQWFEQVSLQIPSLTVRVTADGESRADVRVFVDGALVMNGLTGKSIELNPGKHKLRVELEPFPPFERELVMTEGDRFQLVEVGFGDAKPPQPDPETNVTPEPAAKEPNTLSRPTPVPTYVFGGIGLASAVSGAVLGLSASSLKKELERDCAPRCSSRNIQRLKQRALFTDLSWGVSAVSFATAAAFYLWRPSQPADEPRVDLAWLRGGGAASVSVPLP
jgi:hypothetical protein